MTLPETFVKWIVDRKTQVCHRQLLVITGEHDWVKNSISTIRPLLTNNSIYVGESDWPVRCQNSTYRTQLGLEFDYLVYDVFSGLRANALIALSGTVKSGGLMILLAPDLESWPSFVDPDKQQRTSYGYDAYQRKSNFSVWLVNRIQADSSVGILSKSGFSGRTSDVVPENGIIRTSDLATPDQLNAIHKIVSNYQLNATFQLVLTADRGRGKSAALGLSAQQLMEKTKLNIAVTAPLKSMTQSVFKHVDNKSNIVFIPFDELLSSKQEFDLVFVDEAAALPTTILKSLVSKFPRIVFSTTTHGYEGSGNGFALRFMPYLTMLTNHVETVTLESPVRWFKNDVLESFWFEAMLMTPSSLPIRHIDTIENTSISRIMTSEELISNPHMFYQIFQLLINAHYQTTPDDLVRLLDAQEQNVHVTTTKHNLVIAVALVSLEGGKKLDNIATSISEGKRRVNGHLIPQRLAFVRYMPTFTQKTYIRIIRIAVRADYRRQKIATQLVDHITRWSCENAIDLIGASFGANPEVIKFWQSNEFNAVHLGLKRDASSGEHSLIVLKRCSSMTNSENVIDKEINFLIHKFSQELSYQSGYRLSRIDRKVIELLTLQCVEKTTELEPIDRKILNQFVNGYRPLFSCEYQIAKMIEYHSEQAWQDDIDEYKFLCNLLISKWPYDKIGEHYQLTGKKQIEEYARSCCIALFQAIKKTR